MCMCMSMYTQTHTRARARALTHARTYARTHTYPPTDARACSRRPLFRGARRLPWDVNAHTPHTSATVGEARWVLSARAASPRASPSPSRLVALVSRTVCVRVRVRVCASSSCSLQASVLDCPKRYRIARPPHRALFPHAAASWHQRQPAVLTMVMRMRDTTHRQTTALIPSRSCPSR